MKTSTMQARNLRPTISKMIMALVCASVMGGMAMRPALAKDNDKRAEHQDKGRHKGESHADRDRRGYQRPYYPQRGYYSQPVYAPPPVYYAPEQSPGISIFLPLDIRIR
jgi:hypothetical protein